MGVRMVPELAERRYEIHSWDKTLQEGTKKDRSPGRGASLNYGPGIMEHYIW